MSFQTHKLSDFIKNILICDPKRNEGLMGLEIHEGGWTFGWIIPLKAKKVLYNLRKYAI